MNAHAPNLSNDPWFRLWSMGYKRLTPIMPPDCPVASTSSIAVKIAAGKGDARGKAPGVRRPDGLWVGHDFTIYETNERDLALWRDMGAGIGIVTGDGVVAIDADALSEEDAETCRFEIESRCGLLPCRVGKAPKRLFVCRTASDFLYRKVLFGERNERGVQENRVEILAANRQFVAWGVHPGTLRPYEWTRKLPPLKELPYVEPATLTALMDALSARLPQAGPVQTITPAKDVDQSTLKAKRDLIERAVASIPNTTDLWPSRDDYIIMGIAIKAALIDEPDQGFEVFKNWCKRWTDGENEDETIESDWRRIKPPFSLGAQRIYSWAEEMSGGEFNAAIPWHEEIPGPAPPTAWFESATVFDGVLLQPQKWLAKDLVPARNVTLLYGDGGTGKSLLSLQLAFCVATGTPWLGVDVSRGRAMYLSAEDEKEEIHRRLAAVASGSGFMFDELRDLHIKSLAGHDAVLAAPDPKTGMLKTTPLFERLKAEVARLRPALLVLDTLADLFGGDEIKRIHARQFIQFLQGLVVDADWDMSVVLLGQPSVSGMNSGTGTSGSTAWSNSVRSRLYLERRLIARGDAKVEPDADVRVLSTKKANRAKLGGEIVMRWSQGRFVAEARTDELRGAEVNTADEIVFLALLRELNRTARYTSPQMSARNYAPRVFNKQPKGSDLGEGRLEAAMTRLFAQDVIATEPFGPPSRRYNRLVEAAKGSE